MPDPASASKRGTTAEPMVVIPTYNECENIEGLVRTIHALPGNFHVLIVDDNSPDGTGDIVDRLVIELPRVHVLHRQEKQGIGVAYVAGFQYALRNGNDPILEMDADLSHDPNDLPRLVAASQDADLVIGSRYKGGVRVIDWSVKRLLLSLCASRYVRAVLRMPVEDPTGGFKCFRRQVLEGINLDRITSKGYSFQIEMSYRAWKKGFKLVEVPIVFHERTRGGSKISNHIVYEALYVLWRIRFSVAYERRRSVPLEASKSEVAK